MAQAVTLMIASRASWSWGSGTVSQRMSCLPCHVSAFIRRFAICKRSQIVWTQPNRTQVVPRSARNRSSRTGRADQGCAERRLPEATARIDQEITSDVSAAVLSRASRPPALRRAYH